MTVENFVCRMDYSVWHSMEDFSFKHPIVAKFSSLPFALATLVRDTLVMPAKFLEQGFLIGRSISAYKTENDPKLFSWRKRNIVYHSFSAFGYACLTVLSPLYGVMDAIVTLAKMVWKPLKTAKMNAAKQEYQMLLHEKRYVSTERYEDGKLIDFANEVKFATAASNRFQKQITEAQTLDEMNNIHFINDEASKKNLIEEIALKQTRFEEGRAIYENAVAHEYDVPLPPDNEEEIREATKARRLIAWRDFQDSLISSTKDEASKMAFRDWEKIT